MAITARDPLLRTARLVLLAGKALVLLIMMAIAVTIPAALIFRGELMVELTTEMDGPLPSTVFPAIIAMLALVLILMGTIFWFIRNIQWIVESVGEGDPFTPANADRLRMLGWLTLGVQAVGLVIDVVASFIRQNVEVLDIAISVSLGGLVLALVLFILARVFREGARMREDLEGTV